MVRKKLVLNACGVKSLGGVKLFVEAFELLVESDNEIIVLYSENEFYNDLKNQSLENKYIEFIQLSNKRILHPFYYLITNGKQRKIIENSDAIIHFGNFGFKTKIKSFVLGGHGDSMVAMLGSTEAVSYTHLTLPTKRIV